MIRIGKALGTVGAVIGAGTDLIEHGAPKTGQDRAAYGTKNGVELIPGVGTVAGLTGYSERLAGLATGSERYGKVDPGPAPEGSVAPYFAP